MEYLESKVRFWDILTERVMLSQLQGFRMKGKAKNRVHGWRIGHKKGNNCIPSEMK
jgi:hypothetical protein